MCHIIPAEMTDLKKFYSIQLALLNKSLHLNETIKGNEEQQCLKVWRLHCGCLEAKTLQCAGLIEKL